MGCYVMEDFNEGLIKTISYKNHVVFKKMPMGSFARMSRQYYKNEACFAFYNHGEYRIRDQTKTFDINASTAVLAKCTKYFYESPQYPKPCDSGGEAIGVFLYPEIFQSLFQYDLSKSNYSVPYNMKQVELDQLLQHYRDSIDILLESQELADDLLIENKLREFVILLTKKVGAPSEMDFLASMFKPHIAKFEEVIQSNLYSDLSLDELAKLCNMSLATFKRKFTDTYKEAPRKYITRLKLERAMDLLLTTDKRISEIAFDVGFESVSTFNRAFRSFVQLSPSEYRLSQIA